MNTLKQDLQQIEPEADMIQSQTISQLLGFDIEIPRKNMQMIVTNDQTHISGGTSDLRQGQTIVIQIPETMAFINLRSMFISGQIDITTNDGYIFNALSLFRPIQFKLGGRVFSMSQNAEKYVQTSLNLMSKEQTQSFNDSMWLANDFTGKAAGQGRLVADSCLRNKQRIDQGRSDKTFMIPLCFLFGNFIDAIPDQAIALLPASQGLQFSLQLVENNQCVLGVNAGTYTIQNLCVGYQYTMLSQPQCDMILQSSFTYYPLSLQQQTQDLSAENSVTFNVSSNQFVRSLVWAYGKKRAIGTAAGAGVDDYVTYAGFQGVNLNSSPLVISPKIGVASVFYQQGDSQVFLPANQFQIFPFIKSPMHNDPYLRQATGQQYQGWLADLTAAYRVNLCALPQDLIGTNVNGSSQQAIVRIQHDFTKNPIFANAFPITAFPDPTEYRIYIWLECAERITLRKGQYM